MISIYFGSPGAGKTTLATKLIKQKYKQYDYIFVDFDFQKLPDKVYRIESVAGLGHWTFPRKSLIIIDESGITFNNRAYKSMSQDMIAWFKLHRHFQCDLILLSQSWEDMDVVLRRLSADLWHIAKLGPFTLSRKVYKFCTVDDNTHQIIDGYRLATKLSALTSALACLPIFSLFCRKQWGLTFRPRYYKYFDTYSAPPLPVYNPAQVDS